MQIVLTHTDAGQLLSIMHPGRQLKQVLMAVYFGADHVVWASQAGLYTNKQAIERYALTSIIMVCSSALRNTKRTTAVFRMQTVTHAEPASCGALRSCTAALCF